MAWMRHILRDLMILKEPIESLSLSVQQTNP